ncbi:LCP family protein required for cell wall assembly [Paenibacillus forsythiae]|uniref:LCP family protein required for cell wall assembly n=2 Tax=Paenibacillus forsythiae TaxID=365616 RepID=A0ABU3H9Z8_9BACL|nr:LCP family protein [Paenibacillus forsythiae]MDT3426525.1 LCP family protein required for cell wall assembly [Paenibacillus forsythiae]
MSTRNGSLPPRSRGQGSGGRRPARPSSNNKTRNKNKSKKPGFMARLGRMLLILVLLSALVVVGYFLYLYYKLDSGVLDTGVDRPVAAANSAKVKPLTVLLLGTDYRPEHKSYLTDVIMVVSLNPQTESATIVSLPRDTYMELDGYKRTKINAFYSRFKDKEDTSGISAEDEMKTMMGKYLGVPIDYVTVLNFQAFREVVDELGGVKVNISEDMCYTDSVDGTDINLKKGPAELGGDDALDYVRYRKSNCKPKTNPSDDFDRNRRQSEVLHSLMDQMQSLGGAVKIGGVLDAINDNMKTDIEKDQIRNLIAAYWKMSKENVEFKPVTGTWSSPYVYINEETLDAAKQSLRNRLAGAAPAASVAP